MMNYLVKDIQLPESVGGKVMYGLQTTLIGMLIVFAVLLLIMLVIYLFQLVFYNIPKWASARKTANVPAPEPSAELPVNAAQNDEETVAVLSAAVAAYLGGESASSRYRIRSFRRIL